MNKLKKGDLVKLKMDPTVRQALAVAVDFRGDLLATILQCRHKTGIYLIFPANNPLVTTPYWIEGKHLSKID